MPKVPRVQVWGLNSDISHQTVTENDNNHQPIESHKYESLSIGTRICARLEKNSKMTTVFG